MRPDLTNAKGALPNIHWLALPFPALRLNSGFEALPPVDRVLVAGNASYRWVHCFGRITFPVAHMWAQVGQPRRCRYVRQDDPLWSRLHQGLLTTGRLPQALGFYEAGTAKRLGLGSARVSHGRLLSAYTHLCEERYVPATNPNVTEEASDEHNARVTAAFNATKLAEAQAEWEARQAAAAAEAAALAEEAEDAGAAAAEAPAAGAAAGKRRRGRRRRGKAAAAAGDDGDGAPPGVPLAALLMDSWSPGEEAKLRYARYLGALGLGAVRCAWGSAQEGSTLLALMRLLPGSRLGEVGLCCLEAADLPPEWGFAPGSLPPLGASPDGIIHHCGPPAAAAAAAAVLDGPAAGGELEAALAGLALEDRARCCVGVAGLTEVVEVKNTCPFGTSTRRGGNGKVKSGFVVSDRGPRDQVPPEWVPQLQLHMLAAGEPARLSFFLSHEKQNCTQDQNNHAFASFQQQFALVGSWI